jgi:hypothetical protein
MKNRFLGIQEESFFDWHSIEHFIFGIAVGGVLYILLSRFHHFTIRNYFGIGFIILVLWELFEISLRLIKVYYPRLLKKIIIIIPKSCAANEDFLNIISDVVLGFIGILIVFVLATRV